MALEGSGTSGSVEFLRREDVYSTAKELLHTIGRIPLEVINEESTLDAELSLKSIVFVEIQVALEDIYGIELDPLEMVNRNVLTHIVDYVYEQVITARTDTPSPSIRNSPRKLAPRP